MLSDEPKGWRWLQEMAQRERDPQRLAVILDQLNHLLNTSGLRQHATQKNQRRLQVARPLRPASCRSPIRTRGLSRSGTELRGWDFRRS